MASFESDFKKDSKMRPRKVRLAIVSDNKEALSAMGKKGAEAAAENRKKAVERRSDEKEYYDEKSRLQDEKMRRDANEHIVPVDGEDEREAA